MKATVLKMKALGDTNRFRILMMLTERALCVCEILEVLDIAGGTLSNHLKILKTAGLINDRREGRWIIYELADDNTRTFADLLEMDMKDPGQIVNDRNTLKNINRTVCSKSNRSIIV